MRRDRLDDLLQACLAEIEAGATAEDCLARRPAERDELEPLLRQALRLRVAFASKPGEEFQERAREKLLFAAGRDLQAAYREAPRPEFVREAKGRFIAAAGAQAQEALRAVPPPRLAFWMNARRRLLETAQSRPTPAPARGWSMAFAVRTSLSTAVVVLAIALAGLGYMISQSRPSSVNAELALLEQDLRVVEQQSAAGVTVPPNVIVELSRRTASLVERISAEPAPPVAEKLQPIIERQKEVIREATQADPGTAVAPELREAQQQLNDAGAKVQALAVRAETPVLNPSTTAPTSTRPSGTPTAGGTPATPVVGQAIRITPLLSDTTFGLLWVQVETEGFSAVLPGGPGWSFLNVAQGANSAATLFSPRLGLQGPDGAIVSIDTRTGEINAVVGAEVLLLRAPGPNGRSMTAPELVARAGPHVREFSHMLETVVITQPTTPTTTPTVTPTSTSTSTPQPPSQVPGAATPSP